MTAPPAGPRRRRELTLAQELAELDHELGVRPMSQPRFEALEAERIPSWDAGLELDGDDEEARRMGRLFGAFLIVVVVIFAAAWLLGA